LYSKYLNKKCEADGLKFASLLERNYYVKFKLLLKAGKITRLVCQPKFELIPAFEKGGVKYRALYYVADFGIEWSDGRYEVFDIKGWDKNTGKFRLTKEFILKQKLFEYRYKNITIKLIS
jgi:hypothetical protein